MLDFEKSIRAQATRILESINTKTYEIAWELFSGIVARTPSPSNPGPHAKGVLANQWYPQTGGFSGAKGNSTSATGSDSLSRIKAAMSGNAFNGKDGVLTLTNNLDYAGLAETDGWLKTSPYRMVALSLQATTAKYKGVIIVP